MTSLALGFVLIGLLVFLVILGMQIAYALLGVAFLGIWLIRDSLDLAFRMLELTAYSGIADYLFATIPLFVLMGLLVSVSNVGRDTFEVAEVFLKRMLCGLGVATVAANTVFAAVTGVSIASAAVFTRVAVPEMERHGYRAAFASGTVAGSSVLGMLIPPSLLLIIYGVLAEVSIGGMFIAGIIPGLMLAGGFVVMLMGITLLAPSFVFNDPKIARARRLETGIAMPLSEMIAKLLPIVLLVILVLGGLYTGYFTPTEAGGIGAFGAFIVALARCSLDRRKLWQVMKQTGVVSVSILLLLVAASYYSRMLSIAGLPNAIAGLVSDSGFKPTGFILFYAGIVLLMGMILDSTSILLIMVPIAAPIAQGLGIDLSHFGIITVIAVEIGLLTPPFGISVFTVHNTLNDPNTSVEQIFLATLPFIAVMIIVLLLVTWVPITSTIFL